jgi:uncharacterized integral membrane protein
MGYPYKRRPSLVRTFWIYRYLIAAAMALGLLLWFVLINNAPVTVYFPFRMGQLASTAGIVILLSTLAGSLATALVIALWLAVRKIQGSATQGQEAEAEGSTLIDDRPPTDYASKTTEGFSDANWTRGEP